MPSQTNHFLLDFSFHVVIVLRVAVRRGKLLPLSLKSVVPVIVRLVLEDVAKVGRLINCWFYPLVCVVLRFVTWAKCFAFEFITCIFLITTILYKVNIFPVV